MKKLLQINAFVNSGSCGRITEEIGQLAIQNGWESYIAYGRDNRPSKSKLIKIGGDWDIKMHGFQTRLLDNHGFASKHSTFKLIKQIKEIKPDLIQLHILHGYYVNIEILFNYLSTTNIPIVWTFHDCWPMTGHCVYFDFIGCVKWKTICFNCPLKKSYPASYLMDRSRKNYTLKKKLFTSLKNLNIISVSNWLGNIVQQSFLSSLPMHIIYNGIDTAIFSQIKASNIREKYNLGKNFIILGVANVWSPRKGLNDFLELSKVIDSNTKIVLVGLSGHQIKSLPKNIIGISTTENTQELAEFYSSANIFINTSVEETFGLTTVEALSCGTPAIVYNCTASPELITPETGIVVEKGNIKNLVNAISEIKGKGKEFYSRACRERVTLLFDKNERLMDYLKLYERLIQKL